MSVNNAAALKRVIERDGPKCAWCGEEPEVGSRNPPTLDHIVPVARGGGHDLDNLQMLCMRCNAQKGSGFDEKTVRFHSKVEQAGFTIMPNVVLLDPRLSVGAKAVYLALRYYARQDEYCWPGQAGVAEKLGVTEKTLRGYVGELVNLRLIASKRRGRGETNFYVILALTGFFPPGQHAPDVDKNGNYYRSEPGEITGQERSDLPPSIKQEKKTPASVEAGCEVDPEAVRLCRLLADMMRQNDPKAKLPKPGTAGRDRWVRDMRLLIADRDGDIAEVERVIRWCQADDFERANVLSPNKLRKRFSQLLLKTQTGRPAASIQRRDGEHAYSGVNRLKSQARMARVRGNTVEAERLEAAADAERERVKARLEEAKGVA